MVEWHPNWHRFQGRSFSEEATITFFLCSVILAPVSHQPCNPSNIEYPTANILYYHTTTSVNLPRQRLYGKDVFRILSRPGKMGLGTAYMDGLRIIKGTHVILMDADMSHHPK